MRTVPRGLAFLATALIAVPALAASRISFFRILPAACDLGGDDIAIVHAQGNVAAADAFIQTFVNRANRTGLLRVDVATPQLLFTRQPPDSVGMTRLRRAYRRDTYLAVDDVHCESREGQGMGSTYNSSGDRVKRRNHWVDATCHVRLRALDPITALPSLTIEGRGEGTSPRVALVTDEERSIAIEQAAHFAGVRLAERVAPREVRESVELDETVPDFDKLGPLIDAGRLVNARRVLEAAVRVHGPSAPLHFDIAAISEAMGDIRAAARHYDLAAELAPSNRRFRRERRLFRSRSALRLPVEASPRE